MYLVIRHHSGVNDIAQSPVRCNKNRLGEGRNKVRDGLSLLCFASACESLTFVLLCTTWGPSAAPQASRLWSSLGRGLPGSITLQESQQIKGGFFASPLCAYGCERAVLKRLCLSQKSQVSRKRAFARHAVANTVGEHLLSFPFLELVSPP